jgi:hypothetical protein
LPENGGGWLVPFIEDDYYLQVVDAAWLLIIRLTHYLNMAEAGWLPILRLTLT